jgi:hypothetical protein
MLNVRCGAWLLRALAKGQSGASWMVCAWQRKRLAISTRGISRTHMHTAPINRCVVSPICSGESPEL